MRRVAACGSLVIVALLAFSIALAACGSSSTGPSETQSAAQSAAAFAAGQSVAAKWTDGKLYLATVTAVDGDNVTVTYTDDGTSGTVAAADVRAIPSATFAVGDRVLAVWSAGHFYPGEVTKVEGTAYVVKWDDSSTPSAVETGKIIAE